MKSNRAATTTLLCLFGLTLAGCGKLDAPQVGRYRALIELKGGEAPLPLQITKQDGRLTLLLLGGDTPLRATQLDIQNGELHAVFPNRAGELQARFRRSSLRGEWRLADAQGKITRFPFSAELNANYRFIDQPATDNADVSGYWQLSNSPQSTAPSQPTEQAPTLLNLKQTHDAVEGALSWPTGDQLTVLGQIHGDDVYLSALGAGQVLLLKGKVTAQGELNGKLWINLSDAQSWTAKRNLDQSATDASSEGARQVAFPSAVVTQ